MTDAGRTRYYWCERCQQAVDAVHHNVMSDGHRREAGRWHWRTDARTASDRPCGPVVAR